MKMIASATFFAIAAGTAGANPTVEVDTLIGSVVAAENSGMTLYTYGKDAKGQSRCTGACARNWPPFLVVAAPVASDGSIIVERPDGRRQWATPDGKPLYFWAGDRSPGETGGAGMGGVWDVVRR